MTDLEKKLNKLCPRFGVKLFGMHKYIPIAKKIRFLAQIKQMSTPSVIAVSRWGNLREGKNLGKKREILGT